MTPEQTIELIAVDALLDRVRAMRAQGYRLVQISATRLPEHVELTYSFDLQGRLANLRLQLAASEARVPSISPVYWCAFLYENEMHDLFNLQVDGMAVDFHGNFYKTAVKHAFSTIPTSTAKPAPVATSTPKEAPAAAADAAKAATTVPVQ